MSHVPADTTVRGPALSDSQPFRPAVPPPLGASVPVRVIDSEHVLQGEREVMIRHGAEVYRLRVTRQGKLILQK